MIRKLGRFLSHRGSELILGTLLTVAIGVFGMGISAQVAVQERVTDNALAIARNQERLVANSDKSVLRDQMLLDQIAKVTASMDVSHEALIHRILDLKERLDQRCDTLENLLSLMYEATDKETGG